MATNPPTSIEIPPQIPLPPVAVRFTDADGASPPPLVRRHFIYVDDDPHALTKAGLAAGEFVGFHIRELQPDAKPPSNDPDAIASAFATMADADVLKHDQVTPIHTGSSSGPLDMSIYDDAMIVVRLMSPNLWFSSRFVPATLKGDYGGRYRRLRMHGDCKEGCRTISFVALANPDGFKIVEGFNFNVEFRMTDQSGNVVYTLPITIDPDVVNKGGHP